MKTMVYCTLAFEGFHRWKDAQGEVKFLSYPHRHKFHVKAWKLVTHNDRQVEFITLQRQVLEFCLKHASQGPTIDYSCETWAEHLMDKFDLERCEVSEDGENGAVIEK